MKKVEALAKIRMEEKSKKLAEKEIKQKEIDKSKEDKKSKAYLARHKTKKYWFYLFLLINTSKYSTLWPEFQRFVQKIMRPFSILKPKLSQ